MTNFDKPIPVPGVFSLQDFQNLASFSGAGEDNGFNVKDMFNNRDVDLGFSPFDPSNTSNKKNTTSPNYGFSSKDISNVGGVTRQKEKEEKKTYIPKVDPKKSRSQLALEKLEGQFEDMSFFDKALSRDWWKTEVF